MTKTNSFQNSSIGKKQIIAVTGLALILFVIGHLAGNLFIFSGAKAYIHYAEKLASLRPGLYVVEAMLVAIFVIHMCLTILLVCEKVRNRPVNYAVRATKGERSVSTKLMAFTGTVVLGFVIYHLLDFTFINHDGPRSVLADGQSYGIYGVVINSFLDPIHASIYFVAMICVGLHLSHAIQSIFQTFGYNHPRYTPVLRKISNYIGAIVAGVYASIPLFVLVNFQ
ncbi:hypothetical protein MNBD_BACTEROID05-966 [hydrothermal vent metagenome]|uniref:Succinate dehydrogenase cytochrome b subunit n=1 Tax=hydrothermal vent metagenome TaxID=652676 RepID=A0A3B0TLS4_9ZZZZ